MGRPQRWQRGRGEALLNECPMAGRTPGVASYDKLLFRGPFVLLDQTAESTFVRSGTEGIHFIRADKKLRYKGKHLNALVLALILLTTTTYLESGHGINFMLSSKLIHLIDINCAK